MLTPIAWLIPLHQDIRRNFEDNVGHEEDCKRDIPLLPNES